MNRNKPRGRAFPKGADNPAKHRPHQPKKSNDSLASLIEEPIEIKGVSEMADQAYLLSGKKSGATAFDAATSHVAALGGQAGAKGHPASANIELRR